MIARLRWVLGALDQYGIRMFFGQFSRLFYGNDAGFFNNYAGKKQLKKLQKSVDDTFDSDDNTLHFQRKGYLRVKNQYEPTLIQTIKQKYNNLIDDDNHSLFIGPRIKNALRAIKEPLIDIPELRHLLTPDIQRQIEAYYGAYFKILHVRCWRTYHVDKKMAKQDVYSNLWHNDPFPTTLLRYFVYLSDGVNQETGALHLHSIKNTKKIMRNGYFRRRAIIGFAAKLINSSKETIIFSGDTGDGCLMNPQLCLHRAGVPASGKHRDMVQFTLAPTEKRLSPTWYNELPPDPEGVRGYK